MFRDPEQVALWGPEPLWVPAISLSDNWDLCAMIDEEDYEWARQWRWGHTFGSGQAIRDKARFTGQRSHDKIYAKRATRISGRPVTLYLHVEITKRALGPAPSPKHVSDHLDGDSLNCRRSNLRWATLSQNAKNLFGSALLQTRMDL